MERGSKSLNKSTEIIFVAVGLVFSTVGWTNWAGAVAKSSFSPTDEEEQNSKNQQVLV
jgi:hypothetical protein